ncbi:MAG: hypothetical protein LBJ20_06285 [Candidatus Methanoplasma sp.]|nr:hypothetical protein [Candidatus Methanoplasma sp.]
MFSDVNNYEMKMPKRYVELSEEEMEYDGLGVLGDLVSYATGSIIGAWDYIDRNQAALGQIGLGLISLAGGIAAFSTPAVVGQILGAYAIVDGYKQLK